MQIFDQSSSPWQLTVMKSLIQQKMLTAVRSKHSSIEAATGGVL